MDLESSMKGGEPIAEKAIPSPGIVIGNKNSVT